MECIWKRKLHWMRQVLNLLYNETTVVTKKMQNSERLIYQLIANHWSDVSNPFKVTLLYAILTAPYSAARNRHCVNLAGWPPIGCQHFIAICLVHVLCSHHRNREQSRLNICRTLSMYSVYTVVACPERNLFLLSILSTKRITHFGRRTYYGNTCYY